MRNCSFAGLLYSFKTILLWMFDNESLVAEQAIVCQGAYGGDYGGNTNELQRLDWTIYSFNCV